MSSRIWINVGLIVFILAAIAILQLDKDQQEQSTPVLLSNVSSDTIHDITILREGKVKMRFQKAADEWSLLQPYKAPAHPTRVNSMLGILNTPSTHQLLVNEVDLKELGLEQAETSILLNDLQIDFGTTHPLDNSRYVRIGEKVFTIADHIVHQLNTNPSFFINPKVIPNSDNINAIITPDYSLKWQTESWVLEPDISTETVTSNSLINGWLQLEAQSAIPFNGKPSEQMITVEYKDGEQIAFSILDDETFSLVNTHTLIQYQISDLMRGIIFPSSKTPNP